MLIPSLNKNKGNLISKMKEFQKIIEQNKVFADYIKNNNLTDEEIKELSNPLNYRLL